MKKPSRLVSFATVVLSAAVLACGSSSSSEFPGGSRDAGAGAGGSGLTGDATVGPGGVTIGGGGGGNFDPTDFIVTPATATVDVTVPGAPGTQQLTATDSGKPVNASFRILDRGELGTVGLTTGLFTAAGTLGGVVSVVADYQGATSKPSLLTIKLHATQNGASPTDGGTGGAGGNGGVGGDGSGGPVSDAIKAVLDGASPGSDSAAWLYPYDATVFPRAILPPLLQWQPGTSKDYDGIKIHLVAPNYDYTGYFAKPAASAVFQNHPIDPAAWQALYSSYTDPAAGQAVTVSVTLSSGGKAYALPDHTWTIAGGSLEGTVYYNSYNTHLVTNSDFFVLDPAGNRVRIGAATLAIRADSTGPVVAAGVSSGMANGSDCKNPGDGDGAGDGCDATGCRVCHSVAAKGGMLITQQGALSAGSTNYGQSKIIGLSPVVPEMSFGDTSGLFTFPAISPDGTLVFSGSGSSAGLYKSTDATSAGASGLPGDLHTNMPTFSPDGTHLAFNYSGGAGSDGVSLAQMDYNAASNTFTAPKILYTPPSGNGVAWPSFLPSSTALVFSLQLNNTGSMGETRNSTESQLWWYDVASNKAAVLTNLNGTTPPSSGSHMDDAKFNYEPTVNPVTSGGYAWVVFTSRRLYGNVATLDPFDSDPRGNGGDSLTSPTPKKLWVAAIDLGAAPGTDPSHPAFYLPAQELLAGNSRGYWVVDPCKADGSSCTTGDQCCGGYCQQNDDSGALTCGSTKPMCANDYDKCTTTSDCCNAASGIECLNSTCSISIPR